MIHIANMRKYRDIFKAVAIVLTALTLAAAPCLQAYQLSQTGSSCSRSCNCDVSSPSDQAVEAAVGGACCCRVSSPEPAVEVPLEAQSRPAANPDTFAEATSTVPGNIVSVAVSRQTFTVGLPLTHGPPLYVLNSSYLI